MDRSTGLFASDQGHFCKIIGLVIAFQLKHQEAPKSGMGVPTAATWVTSLTDHTMYYFMNNYLLFLDRPLKEEDRIWICLLIDKVITQVI